MPETRAAVDLRSATVVKQLVIERTLKSSPSASLTPSQTPSSSRNGGGPPASLAPRQRWTCGSEGSTGSRWNGRARSLSRPSSPTTWAVSITRSIVRIVWS